MTAILTFLLTNPTILAVVAGIIGAAGAWFHGRATGVATERNKQAANDAAATVEGQKIDDAVAGSAPADNRKELGEWSKS
ncbi:hypothetical protein [Mesorhizobium sp. M7A.F.Ca.MR.148.00.0.0]|uniref:hypothetical protein n=1 Tax=Mesorhizobium sp. M7A.F.Ca.MR.148.00.0.0 TaxID=2496775 RepID=UPI000FCB093C|nr:hypothetical protein [Mesorhizobium sp. M7A.F.Ca.MR.148.00.0.0]RUV36267.1 hypothetical protein EOB49_17230 [Mesorhizobium sp. M7A.F.Ca.MR.148.00.0.0]